MDTMKEMKMEMKMKMKRKKEMARLLPPMARDSGYSRNSISSLLFSRSYSTHSHTRYYSVLCSRNASFSHFSHFCLISYFLLRLQDCLATISFPLSSHVDIQSHSEVTRKYLVLHCLCPFQG